MFDPKDFTHVKFKGKSYPASYIVKYSHALSVMETQNKSEGLFSVDTETGALPAYQHIPTAALSPHLSQVRLLQLFNGKEVFVFDLLHIGADRNKQGGTSYRDVPELFKTFLSTKRLVAHYATFELQRFMQWGVKDCNIACTWILAKLVLQACVASDVGLVYSLESLVQNLLGVKVHKVHGKSDWSVPELTYEQVRYAALDTVYCYKLAKQLSYGMENLELERIYKLMKAVQHPVAAMQLNGLGFDVDRHLKAIPVWKESLYKAKKEALKITGLKKLTPNELSLWLKDNLSPEHKLIWPRTPGGKNAKPRLATDAHAFSDFDFLPVIKPFSIYQKRAVLCSSFGNKLLQNVISPTKRIHGNINICGARTGRFSASRPNIQQIPRSPSKELKEKGEPDIRASFVAEAGSILICADYSMIELRVAAEISRDKEMLRCFREGIDMHCLTASVVSGIPIEKIDKKSPYRQHAKALNFGLLFGLGANKYAHYAKQSYGVNVSDDKARKDIKAWHDLYAGYSRWQQAQAERSEKTLKCTTPCGKVRALAKGKTYGNSLNHPIQGGAAECIMHSLININNTINREAKIVACIHDEIILEVEKEAVDEYKKVIEDCMTQGFKSVFPDGVVKNLISIGVGENWAEAK